MKRVSELITVDEIKKWTIFDTITIKAGTGVGKSYLIKNILYAFAKANGKKILYLIHRTNCVNQFLDEITRDKKTDVIHIKTYQKLESLKHNYKKDFDFSDYEYIVCDEFHYFLSDAAYNKTTDISLNMILGAKNITKIFMSATGDYMKHYINKIKNIETIDYELPIEYDFIEELTFFNKDESMEKFIEETIRENQKTIFFIQSATKAYDLFKRYEKHCLFNCGKSDKHYKYVDVDKIDNMLKEERFNESVLITTTCMDAGVNIIDTDVKHIVCDVKDINIITQCIGRKRIQNNDDKIYLYIKTINNKQLGGMKSQLKNKIRMADYLRDHTVKEYIEQYPRQSDYSNIVYDVAVDDNDKGTKKINQLMYFKCNLDICDIEIMKTYGNFGHCKYLANKFGFYNKENNEYTYRVIEEDYEKDELQNYLDKIVGQKLFKDEQKELIEKIGLKDARSRLQKSISQLNAYLESNKLNYLIKSERKSFKVEGEFKKKSYWMIYKITSILQ